MSNKNDDMKKKIATGILVGASITGIASSAVLAANTSTTLDDEVSNSVKQSVSTSSERSSRAGSKKSNKDDVSSSNTPAKVPKNHRNTKMTFDRYVFKHNGPGDYQPKLKENQFQHYFIRGYNKDYYGYITNLTKDKFTVFIELFNVGNKLYCADKDGNVLTGFKTINGNLYYFGEKQTDAYARQGWVYRGKDSYYFNEDGTAAKGFKEIEGYTFYFGKDGKRIHDLYTSEDGSLYYFKGSKKMSGLQEIDGEQFYFDGNKGGKAVKDDTVDIGDTIYKFGSDGRCIGMYKSSK